MFYKNVYFVSKQMCKNAERYEPRHEKTCFMPYANNKGTVQLAHPHNLISPFVVHCLDSIIHTLAEFKLSRL